MNDIFCHILFVVVLRDCGSNIISTPLNFGIEVVCKCAQGSFGLFQKEIVSFYLRFSFTPVQFLHSGTSWISGGSPITTGRLPFRNFLKSRLLIVALKDQFSKFDSDHLVLYCCRTVRRIILVNCKDVIAIKQHCPNIKNDMLVRLSKHFQISHNWQYLSIWLGE